MAVRGKVNAILAMTDVEPRLLGMVEDVRFRNLPGAVPYIMTLLERVSSTIRGLTIDPLRDPRTSTSRQPIADILQLELHLLDRPISFSRLTCVQIAPYTTLFAHVLVPLLCAASPNLISLDVGPQHHADLPGEGWVPSPRLAADTSLQRLKLCLPDVDFEYEPLEVWESAMGQLLDVLSRSSNLRQLSVHPGDWLMHYHETLWERAVECCEKHPHLHDVHWEADLNEAEHYFQDFRGLKRLVLSAGSPLDLVRVSHALRERAALNKRSLSPLGCPLSRPSSFTQGPSSPAKIIAPPARSTPSTLARRPPSPKQCTSAQHSIFTGPLTSHPYITWAKRST